MQAYDLASGHLRYALLDGAALPLKVANARRGRAPPPINLGKLVLAPSSRLRL
jgi:hypothetical protein